MIFNFNKHDKAEKVCNKAFLLLGSNLGDRVEILEKAIRVIENQGIRLLKKSNLYETAAWGKTDQPTFLNQTLEVETILNPRQLMLALQQTELDLGRKRLEKWGPRVIDIDILYYANEIIVEEDLKIPHPEIQNRKFTLAPLAEIAGDFVHPVLNLSNKQLLERNEDPLEVNIYKP